MKIQQIGKTTARLTACTAALLCGSLQISQADEEKAAERNKALEPVEAGFPEEMKQSATASISGSVINGKGVITFGDEEVWTGEITEGLRTLVNSIDSNNYAAAWDGEKLVWENVPGAGEKLSKGGGTNVGGIDSNQLLKKLQARMKEAMEKQKTNPADLQKLMEELKQRAKATGAKVEPFTIARRFDDQRQRSSHLQR